jgi:hypothetical protein
MRTVSRSAWIYHLISIRIQALLRQMHRLLLRRRHLLSVTARDYFGLGKPGVAGEERFWSVTELK